MLARPCAYHPCGAHGAQDARSWRMPIVLEVPMVLMVPEVPVVLEAV